MRTNAIKVEAWAVLERLLMPANALVIETMLETGLRVSDVLALTSEQLRKGQRFTVSESKTGKGKRIYIGKSLYFRLLDQCGKKWVFPSARDDRKHRTRQAVWADVKRAAKALRLPQNVAPHSARKSYACGEYERTHDLQAVKSKLNHTNIDTTVLYLLDVLGAWGLPHSNQPLRAGERKRTPRAGAGQ